MTGRIVAAGDPAYDELFDKIETSWFRLETLQHYSAGDGDLVDLFASGKPLPQQDGPWFDRLRMHAAAGRGLRRVHVIEEPPSLYMSFELAMYRDTTAAGEDVRIVPTPAGEWPTDLPRHDFWIFDEDQVWTLRYDELGALVSAEQVTGRDEIAMHQRWAESAWLAAVPWGNYVSDVAPRQAI